MYKLDLENKTKNFIDFKMNQKYDRVNPALRITFKDDYKYNLKVLKKVKKLIESGMTFKSGKINFILINYNNDIVRAFYALGIKDKKKRYTYIYNEVCHDLSCLWRKKNPCKFCDNKCIATKNKCLYLKEDGCCYSFERTKNIFKPTKNKDKCKYLGDDKKCTVKNISCLLFTCKYLTKYEKFSINYDDILLLNLFFNKKEKLIIKYNHFHKEDEIINKLMEKSKLPYLLYLLTYGFTI